MYTEEQYELMGELEAGLVWVWHQDECTDNILHYLMGEGLCQPREDIRTGWLELTQKGRAALEAYRNRAAKKAEQQAEKDAAESKRLEERREDQSDAERRYHGQNKVAIIAAILSASLGVVFGIAAERFWGIVDTIRALLQITP